jgi:hypothetical protein
MQSAIGRKNNTVAARNKNNLLTIMLFQFYVALDEGVKNLGIALLIFGQILIGQTAG